MVTSLIIWNFYLHKWYLHYKDVDFFPISTFPINYKTAFAYDYELQFYYDLEMVDFFLVEDIYFIDECFPIDDDCVIGFYKSYISEIEYFGYNNSIIDIRYI